MALLEVKNIYKSFGDTEVLKGVGFEAQRGEVVAMIGSSGGGKTTLLRCMTLLERPDRGIITVGGETVFEGGDAKISESELRRRRLHFGLVFQQFNLFPQYSAFENICLAPKLLAKEDPDYKTMKKTKLAEIECGAEELLAKVGLSAKRDNYPCQLSGGQQQRVAIARALALKPDVLCFDEPTSALDPELTAEVLSVIKDLKTENMTMVIVTHEMEFARKVADKIIFMADGLIEESGTPDEFFGNPKSEKTKAFLSHSENVL